MSRGELELSAWLDHAVPLAMERFRANAAKLTRVYPLWYSLGDEGLAQIREEAGGGARAEVAALAKIHGVEVWAQVGNFDTRLGDWDVSRLTRVVLSPSTAASHLRQLAALAKADGAHGLSFDFGGLRPGNLGAFVDFAAQAGEAFQIAGLKFSLAVEPGDFGPEFAALKEHAELVQVMACPRPGSLGSQGPIAPPDASLASLKEAATLLGKGSIEFGFPAFACDWTHDRLRALAWPDWDRLVAKHGPAQRDALSAEMVLHQGGHETWCSDSVAILRKLHQARLCGVSKAAFWALGTEDPRIWDMLDDFPTPFAL